MGYFAVYSRKSKFTGKGDSVENQAVMCLDYIRSHYGEKEAAEARIFEDEGFSGRDLNRPHFAEMMAAAGRGEIRAVVCYRLDRISRNIGDFTKLIEELEQKNVGFISLREQFDTDSPMGRAMMYIASVFSQLERETIAERIRDNMLELAKTGRWLGGRTAYGYTACSLEHRDRDGRKRTVFCLRGMEEELVWARRMFDTFLQTASFAETERAVRDARTRQQKNFTRFALRGILKNPVYCAADEYAFRYFAGAGAGIYGSYELFQGKTGLMVYNRTGRRSGRRQKERAVSEWIVAPGIHPAVVSGEEWVRVQEIIESRKRGCEDSK